MTWIDTKSFQLSSAEIALRMHHYSAGFYACVCALLHSMHIAACDEWEDKFFLIKLKRPVTIKLLNHCHKSAEVCFQFVLLVCPI